MQALLDERHGHLSYTAAQNPTVIHRLTRCKVTDPPEPDAPVNPEFYSNILVRPHGHRHMTRVLTYSQSGLDPRVLAFTAQETVRVMQRKVELSAEQKAALVESRNAYLMGVGFYSAALARLQSQLMVRNCCCRCSCARPPCCAAPWPASACLCQGGCEKQGTPCLQALDPTPQESLRNSSYVKWAEASRALQETVEEIHLCHVRLHFDLYHGSHVRPPPHCHQPTISGS